VTSPHISPVLGELVEALASEIASRVAAKLAEGPRRDAPTEGRLLTEEAFADRIGIERKTLQSWRARGKGPRFERFGRAIRYPESEIRDFPRRGRS